MDHAINALRPFLEITLQQVLEEWKSGKYKKLSECPNYNEAKAYVDAIRVLQKACYGKAEIESVQDWIRFEMSLV